jgi:hypothetical protein
MTRKECSECGCNKSQHKKKLCMGCYEIYCDNYKEYMLYGKSVAFISPCHEFKLDNLKYLEQCYERKEVG